MSPLTEVMLDPLARLMFCAVVKLTVPMPLVAKSDVASGKLIVPLALAEKFLFAAKVNGVVVSANVTVLNGLAADPIVKHSHRSPADRSWSLCRSHCRD